MSQNGHPNKIEWQKCKRDFEWDGSLHAIHVFKTTLKDWRLLFAFLRCDYRLAYSVDGVSQALPVAVDEAFVVQQRANPSLQIRTGKILVGCHFFAAEEIEFDFDSREITSQPDLDALLGFMQRVGDVLGKPVIVAPEGRPEHTIITYNSETKAFAYRENAAYQRL